MFFPEPHDIPIFNNAMKDIPWYEWQYAIYEDWPVWSYPKKWKGWHNWQFIKQFNNKSWWGYMQVCIGYKYYLVHRLVAMTFIENPNNYRCVNHKDGDTKNNHYTNLEWCTYSYNIKHSIYALGNNYNYSMYSKQVDMFSKDWKYLKTFESATHAQKETTISQATISRCANNIYKTAWWFKWKFS